MRWTAKKAYYHPHLPFILVIASFMLSSCMVGPDYHSPRPIPNASYTGHSRYPKKTLSIPDAGDGGKAQRFICAKNLKANWWELFHSKQLDCLIRRGISNNPNLAAAKASLNQAKALLDAQIGSTLFPNISAQAYGQRQRFSGANLGIGQDSVIFNYFNLALNGSYTLDFFGGLRRQIEVLGAQMDSQHFELEAAYLTLTSNIAMTAFNIASYREQIQATEEIIASQSRQVNISRKQFKLGGISLIDLSSQVSQLEQTRATLPPLKQALAINFHALSALIGMTPKESELPQFKFSDFKLPAKIPVSLPSALVRQRPDIRASEALLHAALAQVGVATANIYPSFQLTGVYGTQGNFTNLLFGNKTNYWNYALNVLMPVFNGGALIAQKRADVAAYQNAAATYKQTVLAGFQAVADNLRALQHDAENLQAQMAAEVSSRQAYKLVQEQYFLGGTSYLSLLIAERQYHQARIGAIRAQADRFIDTTKLFQSIGGGWWNRAPIDCNALAAKNLSQYEIERFN